MAGLAGGQVSQKEARRDKATQPSNKIAGARTIKESKGLGHGRSPSVGGFLKSTKTPEQGGGEMGVDNPRRIGKLCLLGTRKL